MSKVKFSSAALRYYREKRDMTQADLGYLIDVNQDVISKWESGRIPQKWKQLPAICEHLEIDVIDLITLDTRMLFEWLVINFKDALLRDDTGEIARLSKEVLNWERFFTAGSFFSDLDEAEDVHSSEIEKRIASLLGGEEAEEE